MEIRERQDVLRGDRDKIGPYSGNDRIGIDEMDVWPTVKRGVSSGSRERFDNTIMFKMRIVSCELPFRSIIRKKRS